MVRVYGEGFINTLTLSCQFGDNPSSTATYVSTTEVDCIAPPWSMGQPGEVAVEVSENGVDFTDNDVLFRYANVPALVKRRFFFFSFFFFCGIYSFGLIKRDSCNFGN